MNIFLAALGDPVWQIGGGIIVLAALVLMLALRSPEVHFSPWHQWLWTRVMLLVCFSLFLVLSAGVVLFHGANAASSVVPAGSPPASAAASPHRWASPTSILSPTPLPSPTPFPRLTPGPATYSRRSLMPRT